MKATVRVVNGPKFERESRNFAGAMPETIKDSFTVIKSLFHKFERQLFQTEGGSGEHGKWPALSKAYKAYKSKHYPGKPIMVLEGALQASLAREGTGAIRILSKAGNKYYIKLGTDVTADGFDYPDYHQSKARKKRRPIDLTADQANKFAEVLKNGVEQSVRQTGLFEVVNLPRATMRK